MLRNSLSFRITTKILILLFCTFLPLKSFALETYKYFIEAQSLKGSTGNIETFSPYVLPHKNWSFGLHRFIVGLSYSFYPNLEIGLNFDLNDMAEIFPIDEDKFSDEIQELSAHSKYNLLREPEHPIQLSIGQWRGNVYVALGKFFSNFWDTTFQGGLSVEGNKFETFFAFNQTKSWEQFILDYESGNGQYNFGWRFLVSPEMKLDFFLRDITRIKNIFFDNFIFGITVVG